MELGDSILKLFKDMQDKDPNSISIPKAFFDKMLATNERLARESEREKEREELVCRLLASDMPAEEISLILKIRVEEIRIIENNNARIKIPDYAKKLKARRKSRERAAERHQEMLALISKNRVPN